MAQQNRSLINDPAVEADIRRAAELRFGSQRGKIVFACGQWWYVAAPENPRWQGAHVVIDLDSNDPAAQGLPPHLLFDFEPIEPCGLEFDGEWD